MNESFVAGHSNPTPNDESEINNNWYNFDKKSDPLSQEQFPQKINGIKGEVSLIHKMVEIFKHKWVGKYITESQGKEISDWFEKYINLYEKNDWESMNVHISKMKQVTREESESIKGGSISGTFLDIATGLLKAVNLIGSNDNFIRTADKVLGYDYTNNYESQTAWIEDYILRQIDLKYSDHIISTGKLISDSKAVNLAQNIKSVKYN